MSAADRAALTGKHDTLVRRAPGWPAGKKLVVTKCLFYSIRIHLTRLSTEGLGPRHGEVRRAHQMLNAALAADNAFAAATGVKTPQRCGLLADFCLGTS